jgi:hypothetical protein
MLQYLGNGKWTPGIPARDIEDEEIAEYGGKDLILAAGLHFDVVDTYEPEPVRRANDAWNAIYEWDGVLKPTTKELKKISKEK